MAPTYSTPENQKERYDARGDDVNDKTTADYMREANTPPASVSRGTAISFQKPGAVPSIAAPMLVELIIVSADDFFTNHRPPLPSRLLSVFAIFGVLGFAKGNAAKPAAAFAWALVAASLYAQTGPNKTSGAIDALTSIGNFVSGQYGKTASSATPTANK